MSKKPTAAASKLDLGKQTLRRLALEPAELAKVAGGYAMTRTRTTA